MENTTLIPLNDLCKHHQLEMSFFNHLNDYGLIEITILEESHYVQRDAVADVEKMIRLHKDLQLNFEGIDTVLNMLEKIEVLKSELQNIKSRLRRYEEF